MHQIRSLALNWYNIIVRQGYLQEQKVHSRRKIRFRSHSKRNTCAWGRVPHSMDFPNEADFMRFSARAIARINDNKLRRRGPTDLSSIEVDREYPLSPPSRMFRRKPPRIAPRGPGCSLYKKAKDLHSSPLLVLQSASLRDRLGSRTLPPSLSFLLAASILFLQVGDAVPLHSLISVVPIAYALSLLYRYELVPVFGS